MGKSLCSVESAAVSKRFDRSTPCRWRGASCRCWHSLAVSSLNCDARSVLRAGTVEPGEGIREVRKKKKSSRRDQNTSTSSLSSPCLNLAGTGSRERRQIGQSVSCACVPSLAPAAIDGLRKKRAEIQFRLGLDFENEVKHERTTESQTLGSSAESYAYID